MPRHGRLIASKIYRENISELAAKIFCEPSPKLEPYTFILVENNRMLPYEKNRQVGPWWSQPPAYQSKILFRYLVGVGAFLVDFSRGIWPRDFGPKICLKIG